MKSMFSNSKLIANTNTFQELSSRGVEGNVLDNDNLISEFQL